MSDSQNSTDQFCSYLQTELAGSIDDAAFVNGEYIINSDAAKVDQTLHYLKTDTNCSFEQLIAITAADYPADEKRFEVVYLLLSLKHNRRAILKVRTDDATPVPSVINVYSSADWFEREVWDMFGVKFANHPDLRRLLTDYGFEGHPLRKDFPLSGHYQVRYDEEQKQVIYEPVALTQEFRVFDFASPWEGAKYAIPNELKGDEKATK